MQGTDDVRRFVVERLQRRAQHVGFALGNPADDMNLMESGLFDSLAFVELIAAIEEEFDVEVDFTDVDPDRFTTLAGVVESALGSRSAA
jgi:D-alanine--poly(phosphoribitol) ligase subunit 2